MDNYEGPLPVNSLNDCLDHTDPQAAIREIWRDAKVAKCLIKEKAAKDCQEIHESALERVSFLWAAVREGKRK